MPEQDDLAPTSKQEPLPENRPFSIAEMFRSEVFDHNLFFNTETGWFKRPRTVMTFDIPLDPIEVEAELWLWLDESKSPEWQMNFEILWRALRAECFVPRKHCNPPQE